MQDQLDSRVHELVKKVDGNDCQIVSKSIADVRTRNSFIIAILPQVSKIDEN